MASNDHRVPLLAALKGETTAAQLARQLDLPAAEVEALQTAYLANKCPPLSGAVQLAGVQARIERDRWGVTHVQADSLDNGYCALGFAMGQDRLWQLDYLRRRAQGRLSQIMGPGQLRSDRFLRTVGLGRAAQQAAADLPEEIASVLAALCQGINAAREQALDNLPLEFDLLDYQPEPWSPADSIAVWKWRWWMLTGRLDTIVLAEAARRYLSDDLHAVFAGVEAGEETIVPATEPAGAGNYDTGEGSNNWVVGCSKSTSGKPVLATDPHNALDHPSQWYEAQLQVPGLDAIGAFYLGIPGIYLGRTRGVSWGLTNHTASGRDLYVEEVNPDKPEQYRENGQWHSFELDHQEIPVRGQAPETLAIRRTPRGPLVDEFLTPIEEAGNPPLSLRWAGAGAETGFEAMLGLMRAQTVDQVLNALGDWPFPNLNFVFADKASRIGYHAVGTVPKRPDSNPGFQSATNKSHQWNDQWAFDQLPALVDPERDWVATANNPPWGGTGPYIRLGNWSDGYRFKRIRQRIEGQARLSADEVAAIQADVLHSRGQTLGPTVARWALQSNLEEVQRLGAILEDWDGSYTIDQQAPAVFEAFWLHWLKRLAAVHFPAGLVNLTASKCGAVAARLLQGEAVSWFAAGVDIGAEIDAALGAAAAWLQEKLGADPACWRWGLVYQVRFPHPLGNLFPHLDDLLSAGPFETSGGNGTVRAAGFSTAQPFAMQSGSTYRMVVDMAEEGCARATTTGGQSGHPGSSSYADQTQLWLADEYHPLCMDLDAADVAGVWVIRD